MVSDANLVEADTSAAHLWIILARAYRSLSEYLEGAIAALGICLSDFLILEVLLHKGSLPMSEIAGKVLLANASMTSAADRLVRRGLVVRKAVSGDRRVRQLELTPPGRALIRKLYAQHEHDIQNVMEELSPAERQAMANGLKKIGYRARALSARVPAGGSRVIDRSSSVSLLPCAASRGGCTTARSASHEFNSTAT